MPTADTWVVIDCCYRKLDIVGVFDDKRAAHTAAFNRLFKYWPTDTAELTVEEWDSTQAVVVERWTFKIWRAMKEDKFAARLLAANKATVVHKQDGVWMVVFPERSKKP